MYKSIEMYHSHPSDVAYGNPGFFVDKPFGKVKDSSSRLVEIRPDMSERQSRRILIRTSELSKNSDGVYTAEIRRALNVSAIKLSYASIPRSVSRVTAQLILYSINIKRDFDSTATRNHAFQRLCRNQLLSHDTSDFPFFSLTNEIFDWRTNESISVWINSTDKNTHIPPQFESEFSNQYVDIDILTVKVPSMCSLKTLGKAFANSLKSHSGSSDSMNNSIWNCFDITVEDSGFSVLENINDSEQFTTFASIIPPAIIGNEFAQVIQETSARNTFAQFTTPVTITMKKNMSVYVSSDVFSGSANAPVGVSHSINKMKEFTAKEVVGSDHTYVCTISNPNRAFDSFSIFGDVSIDDILEVKSNKPIQITITELHTDALNSTDSDNVPAKFKVTYSNGKYSDINTNTIQRILFIDQSHQTNTLDTTIQAYEDYIEFPGATLDTTDNKLNKGDSKYGIYTGSVVYIERVEVVTNIREVKRTYQKTRDVRLGLRWGDKKENEDFFIDFNHSFDSPLISDDSNSGKMMRRDVAVMSDSSNTIVNNNLLNKLRNVGDLEDTYIGSSENMTDAHNIHEINDAHQLQRMLFCGHMMNVTEPVAMPKSESDPFPDERTGERPAPQFLAHITHDTITPEAAEFYVKGLGWQTSIVHEPSRFIMPAFPVRFTETGQNQSIYGSGVQTSVSPIVSRVLNKTNINNDNIGYYRLKGLDESGNEHENFNELHGKDIYENANQTTKNVSYYVPREDHKCGIVVTIGNENYIIKSARLVSVLRNETDFTLDLNCDRNQQSTSIQLSSVKNLQRIRDNLITKNTASHNERKELRKKIENIETEISQAFLSFYKAKKVPEDLKGYDVNINSKYFSWVYELDRPVKLPTGIPGDGNPYVSNQVYNPPVTQRSFNGIADLASMFTPGVYERETGRAAINMTQENAQNFFVRSGSEESENPLLVLHGIGCMERPLNSKNNMNSSDVFAVMGGESDFEKPEKMLCENTVFFKSPDNIDKLKFHFINSKTGEKVDIGNQNATLVFDVYSSNE
jgi:hypothetical protein